MLLRGSLYVMLGIQTTTQPRRNGCILFFDKGTLTPLQIMNLVQSGNAVDCSEVMQSLSIHKALPVDWLDTRSSKHVAFRSILVPVFGREGIPNLLSSSQGGIWQARGHPTVKC
jgi:hypothetical protein